MAKSGMSSSVAGRDSSRSAGTRARLIEAAIETLQAEGFAGSSARAIAARAGVNQGVIFYHFDSVANLLLAALDSVSARRMEHYGAAIDGVGSPTELVDVATAIFREDLDAGYVAVLVEMIAGASSTPGRRPPHQCGGTPRRNGPAARSRPAARCGQRPPGRPCVPPAGRRRHRTSRG